MTTCNRLPTLAAVLAALTLGTASAANIESAEYDTPEGRLTVRWGQPDLPAEWARPATMELDVDGDGAITLVESTPNLALYSDFDFVDRNRDGRVTAAELARWD